MAPFNTLTLSFIILASFLVVGCVDKNTTLKEGPKHKKNIVEDFKEIIKKQEIQKISNKTPAIILPPVYEEPTLINSDAVVNFSANDVPLSKLLFIISKEAGLNLIVDDAIDKDKLVTVNMVQTSIKDALNVAMELADTYFKIEGNMLYIKKFMTKTFKIPFINMRMTSASSSLGGDILGQGGAGLAGSFTLNYESDAAGNDFYGQFIQSLDKIKSKDGIYSLNKFSGTLIVTDLKSKIKQIEEVVGHINHFISKQVLVDAKIMEVTLNNEHQLGVNWENLWNVRDGLLSVGQNLGTTTLAGGITTLTAPISGGTATTIAYTRKNFQGIISAMETSGDIEVVSNPRIKIINGQTGIISSGSTEPYWEKQVTYSEIINAAGNKEYVPTTVYNRLDVLNGISLGVTPIIRDDGTVLLNIIPIITNIESEKVFSDGGQEVARAPIINVKEIGTTVIVRNNDLLIIGGLISSTRRNSNYKTPGLAEIPLLGALFRRTEDYVQKKELVIILKINIEKNNL
ncbi:MAG: hypothetical protein KAQ94_06930 [Arcobacteraceae bacterium]|nr:hypothetical protein [Arcobacteraceae bacterium]